MSLLRTLATQSDQATICPTCAVAGSTKTYLLEAGPEYAVARRCPSCAGACAECGGEGLVLSNDRDGRLVSRVCSCRALDARLALYNAARVPRLYASKRVESFEPQNPSQAAAKTRALKVWRGFRPGDRGLGLMGPVGCGKTHLLAGIILDLTLECGIPCRYAEFSDLLSEIRAGYDAGRNETDIISHLVDVPVLVIDELGKGLTTEWQVGILDTLISMRYNRAVSTFFASNFQVAPSAPDGQRRADRFRVLSLEEQIGSRMFSRLCEMCELMGIEGPDWRRRALSTAAG